MLRREVSALSNACVQESTAFDAHFRDGASQQGLEQDNALLSQLVAEYGLFSALASGLARSFDETFAMPLARESVVQEVDACRLHCLWLLASQRRFSAPVVQRWTDRHLASFSFAKRDDGTALMRIDLTVLGGSTGGFGADRIAGSLARSIVSPQVIEADYARRGDPQHFELVPQATWEEQSQSRVVATLRQRNAAEWVNVTSVSNEPQALSSLVDPAAGHVINTRKQGVVTCHMYLRSRAIVERGGACVSSFALRQGTFIWDEPEALRMVIVTSGTCDSVYGVAVAPGMGFSSDFIGAMRDRALANFARS